MGRTAVTWPAATAPGLSGTFGGGRADGRRRTAAVHSVSGTSKPQRPDRTSAGRHRATNRPSGCSGLGLCRVEGLRRDRAGQYRWAAEGHGSSSRRVARRNGWRAAVPLSGAFRGCRGYGKLGATRRDPDLDREAREQLILDMACSHWVRWDSPHARCRLTAGMEPSRYRLDQRRNPVRLAVRSRWSSAGTSRSQHPTSGRWTASEAYSPAWHPRARSETRGSMDVRRESALGTLCQAGPVGSYGLSGPGGSRDSGLQRR